MPDITITCTQAVEDRIVATMVSMSDERYQQDMDGFREYLMDHIKEFVRESELAKARKEAVAATKNRIDLS